TATPLPGATVFVYAVTPSNRLLRFSAALPSVILNDVQLTGLQPNETVRGIDFRPATGNLYGLGSTNRIYRIDTGTGVVTSVNGPFTPSLLGIEFGFDFNPSVDRIRIVSDLGQNLRVHPDTGMVVAVDGNLAYAPGDPNSGNAPNVVAAAYSNNFPGPPSTTLYDIDSNLDILVTQNPPNNGTLNTVGSLGVNTSNLVGLDIASVSTAYGSLTGPGNSTSELYTINLGTGAATLVGTIAGGETIRDITLALTAPAATNTPAPATSTPTATQVGATSTATQALVTATPTACPLQFTDVPVGSTFYSNIRCLSCRGIINGYSSGCESGNPCFRPQNNVTRGQLSKIVSNSAGFSEVIPSDQQSFEDVLPGSTFWAFIERLNARGIVNGYPCGEPGEPCVQPTNRPYFRPNNNATRGQISKIVAIARGWTDPQTTHTFQDVPPDSTFYIWIENLAIRGVMSGYACGGPGETCVPPDNRPYFRPGNLATRGQTSKIVANTFFPNCQTP
ncbi:MAG: DUF4394 domain-containing protein, partial [Chloroflexia bacterium]